MNCYDLYKALHIISVISWMAGMLYLPRLYVYHADADKGSELSETFKIMERRLLRIIINPAMILTFIFGGLMIWENPEIFKQGWMHAKITLVVLMTGFHGLLARWRKQFVKDQNTRSAKFYRRVNEVPTVLMIIIVILVVMKPF
ncbi:MAG: protoporphyrinogen oxidase HemJ [Alphaproteobacteria bacterium]